ncbi:hypothetical protein DERP_006520 [Dermatophagoides pteronyssinus]|uniref:Uncharacterized protein n=1 Tax=Dermatophagoides pteronyssinus TaxID=6956 RepID=A0ABQ8IQL7_DERPT|nr:hypothetical protein DERP_006520 [Dermatophagoides pteronyssinus]
MKIFFPNSKSKRSKIDAVAHSCNDFCKRLTCNGLAAIPTNAIISKNSSSPASYNCCTSSPP